MSNRVEMLEATLDLVEQGVAVLDEQSNVVFWNQAAADLTGYGLGDVISRQCPDALYRVDEEHRDRAVSCGEGRGRASEMECVSRFAGPIAGYSDFSPMLRTQAETDGFLERAVLVSMRHHQGHTVPAMLRKLPLCSPAGTPSGTALLFYPVEEVDALPHGEGGEGVGIERSSANMEDRLDAAQHQWVNNRVAFGLLWVTVDQAQMLRRTHGRDACEAMLRIVEQTLWRQMKPTEIIGRWGDDEFLVLAHQRTAEQLAEHAQRLAGLARTADFRWWGDRVSLTVSIGASQAVEGDTLQQLLNRARQAMQTSRYAGGNHVTGDRGGQCSQS